MDGEVKAVLKFLDVDRISGYSCSLDHESTLNIQRVARRLDIRLSRTKDGWIFSHLPEMLRNARWLRARFILEARSRERSAPEWEIVAPIMSGKSIRKFANQIYRSRSLADIRQLYKELEKDEYELDPAIVLAAHDLA